MLEIALFGTSADPPTTGHQAILEWLATRFDEVAVWAADNPFKSGQTPLVHRQAMLALLLDSVRQDCPNVHLCDRLSNARSLNSVRLAQQCWPQARLSLVVGSDVLASLPSWYRIEELLQSVRVQIVPRPGFPVEMADLKTLKDLGGQFAVAADFVGPDVSSTAYRQTQVEEGMIPAIAAYIREYGLYNGAKRSAP
ncbi:nicotinate-nucleotide adenylyltransferase [Altericista sp. CCNU0014]|uniref:nicotinate-nucleotide adenylyltransferase n=1 Tax=Altericista sp. CCNU0014 TaxID=3082949 RepID=UPI00384DB961